jgi:hypothetical protein
MTDAEYFAMNRAGWDQRVKAHVESRFYDVDGFLSGALSYPLRTGKAVFKYSVKLTRRFP